MLKSNVGGIDRVLRIVIGAALVIAYFLMPNFSMRWILLIGLIPLLTGVLGTCPLYSVLGISTCPMKR